VSYRLVWSERALSQLEAAAEWSIPQAVAVVNPMEWLARSGFSLGRPITGTDESYWPVPPRGALYLVSGSTLEVTQVVDPRRRSGRVP
jgi:hypothetical protein